MAEGGESSILYSIQQTYILTVVSKLGKEIVTCNQRIDIPTIEPLVQVMSNEPLILVPCIELAGDFLAGVNLTFETNEGVTVLPVEVPLIESIYENHRYVLVLPRGSTGVKSCKLIHKATGKEVQHNFTFGIMPPPYNYDNASLGPISYRVKFNYDKINNLEARVTALENKAGT